MSEEDANYRRGYNKGYAAGLKKGMLNAGVVHPEKGQAVTEEGAPSAGSAPAPQFAQPEEGVVIARDVAEYCLESAMMLRQRLEIAPHSPEYKRVCEVQTALEDSLEPQKS